MVTVIVVVVVVVVVVEKRVRGRRNEWYAGENVVHVAGADGIG